MGITAIVIAVLVVINLINWTDSGKIHPGGCGYQKLYTISDTTEKYLKDMEHGCHNLPYRTVRKRRLGTGKNADQIRRGVQTYQSREKKTQCYIRTLLHSIPAMMWQITV